MMNNLNYPVSRSMLKKANELQRISACVHECTQSANAEPMRYTLHSAYMQEIDCSKFSSDTVHSCLETFSVLY